jgi:hypothetical protein
MNIIPKCSDPNYKDDKLIEIKLGVARIHEGNLFVLLVLSH